MCQQTKVHRHVHAPVGRFPDATQRFAHVHVDIVGPLPPSKGMVYMLTICDRYTRWVEAIPIQDVSAETVTRAFVYHWVARFGCPVTMTTDQGPQFESTEFSNMLKFLGCERVRTTAYHPAANGMVERFHRQLKAALASSNSINWVDALGLVLLGIRTALKSDLATTTAELVYGEPLRLPGEFFAVGPPSAPYDARFAALLADRMRSLGPNNTRAQQPKAYIPTELSSCTHVFIRVGAKSGPLGHAYEGPYRIVQRLDRTIVVDRRGRRETFTIDRVKAAHIDSPADDTTRVSNTPSTSSTPTPCVVLPQAPVDIPPSPVRLTRSGRRVHWPRKLAECTE
ncbi:MAG: integrase catalytic domain-containing protein [Aeromonas sp.]